MRLVNIETYIPGTNTVPTDLTYPLDHTKATKGELEEITLAIVHFYQKNAEEIGLKGFDSLQGIAVFPKTIRDPRADLHLHFVEGQKGVTSASVVLQPEDQLIDLEEEQARLIEELDEEQASIYLTIPTNNIYRQLRYLSLEECLYFFKANIIAQLKTKN